MLTSLKKRLSTFGSIGNTANSNNNNNNNISNNDKDRDIVGSAKIASLQHQHNNNNKEKTGQESYKRKKDDNNDSDNEDSNNNNNNNNIGNIDSDSENEGEGDDFKRRIKFQEPPSKKQHQDTNNNINNNDVLTKFKKRKSILLPTTANNFNNNNNSNEIQQNASSTNTTLIRTPVLDNQNISDLYQNTIKMSSENKITQKNSWSFKIIDNIKEAIEINKKVDTSTNFQAASCVLDASIKIYSCRVDSVHVNTFKVLGGLSRGDESVGDEDDDKKDGDNEKKDGSGNGDEEKNKRKRKKSGINTLEENLENITVKKFDLNCTVDPLFSKTTAAFDEGGPKGLLLNSLSVYDDCKIVFDSNDAIYYEKDQQLPTTDSSEDIDKLPSISEDGGGSMILLDQWKHLFESDSFKDLQVCPTYYGFSEWSNNDGSNQAVPKLPNPEKKKSNLTDGEEDAGNKLINNNREDNELVRDYDENLANIGMGGNDNEDEYDYAGNGPSWNDGDYDDPIIHGLNENENVNDQNKKDMNFNNDISLFERNDNQDGNLFDLDGAFDQDIDINDEGDWAGPEHWKFKKINRRASTRLEQQKQNKKDGENQDPLDKQQEKKKRTTRKKQLSSISFDFNTPLPDESKFEISNTSSTTLKKQLSTTSTATTATSSTNNNLLPPDIHFSINKLSRLFTKPQFYVPTLSERYSFTKKNRRDINEPISSQVLAGNSDKFDQDYDENYIESSNPFENNNNGGNIGDNNNDDGDDYYDLGGGGPEWDDDETGINNNINNNDDGDDNNSGNINNNNQLNDQLQENIDENEKTTFVGLNNGVLVSNPKKVNKIDISYAKVSSKVNVKQLKSSVWNIIEKQQEKESDQNHQENFEKEDSNSLDNNNNNNLTNDSDNNSFGSLIDNLHIEQKELRSQNKQNIGDVSISLSFLCVLHLANENNLSLDQDNINNFIISKHINNK